MSKKYQEQDKKKLLRNGDKVIVRVPGINHPITINEIHAFQMGLLGLFVGLAYSSGYQGVASMVAMLAVGYAILGNPIFKSMNHDDPKYKTIGMRTIKHEPWWFTVPFTASFVIGITVVAPILG
jgi:hypothetical protein